MVEWPGRDRPFGRPGEATCRLQPRPAARVAVVACPGLDRGGPDTAPRTRSAVVWLAPIGTAEPSPNRDLFRQVHFTFVTWQNEGPAPQAVTGKSFVHLPGRSRGNRSRTWTTSFPAIASTEAEVELVPVQPGDLRVDALRPKLARQPLVMPLQAIRIGRVVVRHHDRICRHPHVPL